MLNQIRSQLDALRVDIEPSCKYFTTATHYIKITAGCLGIKNSAALIFYFFKTASTALFADGVPLHIGRAGMIHVQRLTRFVFDSIISPSVPIA